MFDEDPRPSEESSYECRSKRSLRCATSRRRRGGPAPRHGEPSLRRLARRLALPKRWSGCAKRHRSAAGSRRCDAKPRESRSKSRRALTAVRVPSMWITVRCQSLDVLGESLVGRERSLRGETRRRTCVVPVVTRIARVVGGLVRAANGVTPRRRRHASRPTGQTPRDDRPCRSCGGRTQRVTGRFPARARNA